MKIKFLMVLAALVFAGFSHAAPRVIHLDEYNGYFAAEETLANLPAGEYTFIVTNKAGKVVGFQIQDQKTHKQLDLFPLEVGETRSTTVTIGKNGFRYRCPINPTPWYDVDVR
ncbi:hypothetical protein [Bacterioplanoides sp.]|uniref:hypothetical protein n=1 Tax=Bacterioplanoides sp. TaxID=2066072 RepID=UPI003AFF676F